MTRERNKRRVDNSDIAECTSSFKRMAVTVASDETELQKANLHKREKSKSWKRKTQSRQVDNTKTQPKTDKFTLSLEDQISAMLKIIRAETESEIKPTVTPSTSFADVCVDSSNKHKLCRKMSKNAQESKDDSCLEDKQVSRKPLLLSKTDGLCMEKKSIAKVVTTAFSDPSPQAGSVGTQKSTTVNQNSVGTQKFSSVDKRKRDSKSKQISRKRGTREGPDKSSKRTKTSSGDDGMLDRLVRLFAKLTL